MRDYLGLLGSYVGFRLTHYEIFQNLTVIRESSDRIWRILDAVCEVLNGCHSKPRQDLLDPGRDLRDP